MTDNLNELERLLAKATPGEWEVDSERNEDCSPKYHDYFIGAADSDGKWITLFDSVNSDGKLIEEEYDEDYHHAWDAVGKANAALIVALRNAAPFLIATAREVKGLRHALVTAMLPIEAILLSGADAAHCQDVRDALHDARNTARAALKSRAERKDDE